jgi:general secretion pathway protein K
LQALDLDPRFAELAADWLDWNQNADGVNGAEDAIYTGMIPPYRTANQPIVSVSEFAALQGMDKATLDTLRPHIIALPELTKINANTASGPVLQSLAPNIEPSDAEGLIADRENAPWEDTDLQDPNNPFTPYGADIANDLLRPDSQYFQLKVVVQIATVRITYYSLLYRGGNQDLIVPILRSFGTI